MSLSKLVREFVGARLGKGLTFTHWDQRPLSAQQLKYAADDVRYLPAIRARARPAAGGARPRRVGGGGVRRAVRRGLYRFDPETAYLHVRGAARCSRKAWRCCKQLVIWRDGAAQQHDVPPRAFLKDEILIDMSREPVKSVEKLARVRGLPRPVEQRHGAEIVEATQARPGDAGRGCTESRTSRRRRRTSTGPTRCWAVIQCICIGQKIDPDLVTAGRRSGGFTGRSRRQEPAGLRLLTGWRRQAATGTLLEMVAGRAGWSWGGGRTC